MGLGGLWPCRPLLAVPNVTSHPSTASVPITVLLCDGPFLCGFNVAIKGLSDYSAYVTYIILLLMLHTLRNAGKTRHNASNVITCKQISLSPSKADSIIVITTLTSVLQLGLQLLSAIMHVWDIVQVH